MLHCRAKAPVGWLRSVPDHALGSRQHCCNVACNKKLCLGGSILSSSQYTGGTESNDVTLDSPYWEMEAAGLVPPLVQDARPARPGVVWAGRRQ